MNNGDKPATGYGWSFLSEMNGDQTNNGLTKREHFAGLAMQGFCANLDATDQMGALRLAAEALVVADALLEELEK